MEVSEPKRLKQFEDANAKLNKLLAKQMLDVADIVVMGHTVAQVRA